MSWGLAGSRGWAGILCLNTNTAAWSRKGEPSKETAVGLFFMKDITLELLNWLWLLRLSPWNKIPSNRRSCGDYNSRFKSYYHHHLHYLCYYFISDFCFWCFEVCELSILCQHWKGVGVIQTKGGLKASVFPQPEQKQLAGLHHAPVLQEQEYCRYNFSRAFNRWTRLSEREESPLKTNTYPSLWYFMNKRYTQSCGVEGVWSKTNRVFSHVWRPC